MLQHATPNTFGANLYLSSDADWLPIRHVSLISQALGAYKSMRAIIAWCILKTIPVHLGTANWDCSRQTRSRLDLNVKCARGTDVLWHCNRMSCSLTFCQTKTLCKTHILDRLLSHPIALKTERYCKQTESITWRTIRWIRSGWNWLNRV